MITGIKIKRFRGIKEGELSGLEQFTILIGKNGSGKSSVLEAIYAASAHARKTDPVRRGYKLDYIIKRRGDRGDWRKSRQILWYRMEKDKPIQVEATVGHVTARYEIRNTEDPGRAVKLVNRGEKYKKVDNLLANTLLVDPSLLSKPKLVEKETWAYVAAWRLDKAIIEMIREEFEPSAEGLTYLPIGGDTVLALQTPTTTVRVDDLGDGVRSAILLALLVLGLQPSILLLEEPETHMHPAGLKSLTSFLVRLAGERGFQVIASTHSLDFIRIAIKLAGEHGVGLKILFLERTGDGTLESRIFTPEDLDALQKLGVDVRLSYAF